MDEETPSFSIGDVTDRNRTRSSVAHPAKRGSRQIPLIGGFRGRKGPERRRSRAQRGAAEPDDPPGPSWRTTLLAREPLHRHPPGARVHAATGRQRKLPTFP